MAPTLRPLHLHTLDSLCADLISGRPVGVGADDAPFILTSDTARAALHWYFTHKGKWAGNVMAADVEAIVDAVAAPAPTLPAADALTAGASQRYTLVSIRAHQFGGLHHPGSGEHKPDVLEFAFAPQATMLEGFNGSGKTSIVNAIVWALTGEILRPQRSPESGNKDFTVEIDGVDQHALPPVTPLPDPSVEKPVAAALPVNTWVELVFEGEDGKQHTVRRSLQRTPKGALKEEFTGLLALGLDPIAVNVGTVMPGLLPFIQIGTESKLGKAVSELTGMAPLVKLASHADRARKKLDVDLTKERNNDIATIDEHYLRSHADLASRVVTCNDHRLQGGDVIGERGGIGLHAPQCRKRRRSLQGERRAPGAFWLAPVNALEQHRELRRCQVNLAAVSLRPDEATSLQALGQQAQTVTAPPKHLDQVCAPATEDKDVTAVRILGQSCVCLGSQTIKTAAHVGDPRSQPHARSGRQTDHAVKDAISAVNTAISTGPVRRIVPRSSRISTAPSCRNAETTGTVAMSSTVTGSIAAEDPCSSPSAIRRHLKT